MVPIALLIAVALVGPASEASAQPPLPMYELTDLDINTCDVAIDVRNNSYVPAKVSLITWDDDPSAGPTNVACGKSIRAGQWWTFEAGQQLNTDTERAVVFSFTMDTLSKFGWDRIFGFDDIIGNLLCETAFFGVVRDQDDYDRFEKAFRDGTPFAGIPMDKSYGPPLLAYVRKQNCPEAIAVSHRLPRSVSNQAIADALANPHGVPGYDRPADPNRPLGPRNSPRRCLSLHNPAMPYHPIHNWLEFTAGCR